MWHDFPDDPARRSHSAGERPRAEPEIIPPGKPGPRRSESGPRVFMSFDDGRGHRMVLGKPSPWAIALGLLGLGLAVIAAAVVLLGLFLLWLPVAGVLVAAFVVTALLRGNARRVRRPPYW